MTGLEVLAGAVVGYLVRRAGCKAGPVAGEVVDRVLDAGLEELAGLVDEVLGQDEDVAALTEQTGQGSGPDGGGAEEFTRQIAVAKIARAAGRDEEFAERLRVLVERLEERYQQLGAAAGGGVRQRATASGHGRVYQAGRDQTINEK